jgi:ABC-type multidrug transport system fused ATPase/permease subunit
MAKTTKRYSKKNISKFVKNSVWALKVIFRLSPRDATLAIGAALLTAVIPIGTSFYSSRFIDEIISLAQEETTGFRDLPLEHPIFITLALSVLLHITNNVARRLSRFMRHRFRRMHLRDYELKLYKKMAILDVQQFEDPKISNSIQKAKDNFYKIHVFFDVTTDFLTQFVSTTLSAGISLTVSPLLSLVIFLLSIPNNYFYAHFTNKIWQFYNSFIEENRKRWWLIGYLTNEKNLPEQKISKSENFLFDKTRSISKKLWTKEVKLFTERFFSSVASTFINAISYILVPLNLLNKYLTGNITLGDFTFYQSRFLEFSGQLDFLLGQFLDIFDSAVYIGYVRNILELEPAIKSGDTKIDTNKPPKIEFKNVYFKYPKSDKYVLKDINLTIEPGQEIALVGKNGAGKTTLIKLLLRFYDPTKGQVLVNDIPLSEVDLDSYYETVGAIFQEFNFYGSLTTKENIVIGKPQDQPDIKRIREAADKAAADAFIEKLDNKYDQILSKKFSKGTNLSWGQMQKIALSRMFYRDSSVLILDEPTASIDTEAEYKIFKRIYEFIEGKTVIIISHRFSTVKNADKIFVLEDGKIVESGTHDNLLEKDGKYAKSFNLQAQGYQE